MQVQIAGRHRIRLHLSRYWISTEESRTYCPDHHRCRVSFSPWDPGYDTRTSVELQTAVSSWCRVGWDLGTRLQPLHERIRTGMVCSACSVQTQKAVHEEVCPRYVQWGSGEDHRSAHWVGSGDWVAGWRHWRVLDINSADSRRMCWAYETIYARQILAIH